MTALDGSSNGYATFSITIRHVVTMIPYVHECYTRDKKEFEIFTIVTDFQKQYSWSGSNLPRTTGGDGGDDSRNEKGWWVLATKNRSGSRGR